MGVYRFHECMVDPTRREITHAGQLVDVQPLVFDLLLFFVQNPNRVVTKDEMLRAAWRSTVVSDSVVARGVMKLRRAIGDDAAQARILLTVHRVGYRFAAEVRLEAPSVAALPAELPNLSEPAKPLGPPQGLAVTAMDNASGDTTIDALMPELDHLVRHLVQHQIPLASVTASDALQVWQASASASDPLAAACARLNVQELAVLSIVHSDSQYTLRLTRGSSSDGAVSSNYTGPDLLSLASRAADTLLGATQSTQLSRDGDQEFWRAQYARALRLNRERRFEPALELLELCRAHLTPTLQMLLMQARLHLELHETELARAQLQAAWEQAQADGAPAMQFDVKLAMAEAAIAEGQIEQGVQACSQALTMLRAHPELAGEAPKLIMRFVDALSAEGRASEAVQMAERAVATAQRLGHRSVELSCRLGLGQTLLRFRQLHRASEAFRRVIDAAQPADSLIKLEAMLMLSETERTQQRHQSSVDLACQARTLARRMHPARVQRAITLELQGLIGTGDTDAVEQLLKQRWGFEGGLDPAAPSSVVHAHAVVLWRQGNTTQAVSTLMALLESAPTNLPAADLTEPAAELCFMLAAMGELTSLELWAEPLLHADDWLRARLEAALALARGARDKAKKHLSDVWFANRSNPWDGFDLGVDLAWILLEDGESEALERVISQVLEMPSDHGPVQLLQSAYALRDQGDDRRAREWKRNVAMRPGLLRRHPAMANFMAKPLPELLTRACH